MYEYESRVRLSEVDQERKMTLNAVLNYFQDCSTFQSEDLGVGIDVLEPRKRMWVLNSWKIEVNRYPELGEHIKVGTWPFEFGRMTGMRNFCMLDEKGQMTACAETLWVYMDTRRMRPARVDEDIRLAYETEPKLDLGEDTRRITVPEELEARKSFEVQPFHLDVNHHVNNGQYVQIAGAYLPEDFRIHQMRAEYKKSAVLGDTIFPQVGRTEEGYIIVLGSEDGKPYATVEFK